MKILRQIRVILRSLRYALHSPCSTKAFPLTLILALRERKHLASGWRLAGGRCANSGTGVISTRCTILPLPKGEGRGEGEPRFGTGIASLSVRSVIACALAVLLGWGAHLCAEAAATPRNAKEFLVYIGTYTGGKSKGDYFFPFDPASGKI